MPITDARAILATLTIAIFTGTEALFYMEPTPDPTIPGSMAIYDAAHMGTPIVARPASGDYANPVFGTGCPCNAPKNSSTWSAVKTLYR